jgi:hypothetical protein
MKKEFRWIQGRAEEWYLEIENEEEFKKELVNWIKENGSLNIPDFGDFSSVDIGILNDHNDEENEEYERNKNLENLYQFIKEEFDIDVKDMIE